MMSAMCREAGLQYISVVRPVPSGEQHLVYNVGGGVAFLAPKSITRITLEAEYAKGGLSVIVSVDGAEDFAAMGVYLPPITSSRAVWRAAILAWAAAEYKRLSARYRIVLCFGDFNARLGVPSAMRRFTEDWKIPQHAKRASKEMAGWCAELGVEPVHGRTLALPGRTTCRSPSGVGNFTEADYILTDASNHDITPLPMVSWGTMPNMHCHRMLAAVLEVPGAGSAPHVRQRPPTAQWHLPAPGDKEWHAMADTVLDALQGAAEDIITSPTSSLEDALEAFEGVLETGMKQHLQRPQCSIRSTVHRTFSRASISPQAAAALQKARQLRRRANQINQSPKATHAARVAAENIKRMADKIQRDGTRRARRELRRWQRRRVADLQKARPRDAHAMFKTLNTVSADNPGLYTSDARIPDHNGVPASESFPAHWKELFHETRPVPAAVGNENWMQHVPVAAPDDVPPNVGLSDNITTEEVMLAVFPQSRHPRLDFVPCHVDCKPCGDYAVDLQRWQRKETDNAPVWTPCIHTSKAAGPDGVPAEALRFPRPEDPGLREGYRRRVSAALASLLTKVQERGNITPAMAQVRVSALLKSVKPGQHVERDNPDCYRGIAVGNFLAKLMGVLLTARLSHWAIRKGLMHASQVGFLPRHSAEWHVLTVTQTIKARARAGQSTYALFVDLRKAYDSVHREAMWAVLERMGVPAPLLSLLKGWATTRQAQMRVNGVDSEPFDVEKGVPQGDPLSPLLFNLFLESLSRLLEADPHLRSISALGVTLRKLLYADDVVVLADSPEQLQHALSLIHDWCEAWGMEVSVGQGKTEAITFASGLSDDEAVSTHAPLRCGGARVDWVAEYRYLGYMLRHDLDDKSTVKKLAGKLIGNFERYFTRNGYVRGSSVMMQLQVYKTCATGSINYLRSVVGLDSSVRDQLDTLVKSATRMIASLPPHSSTVLAWMRSRLFTAAGICARERERLRLQLLHTSYPDAIAAQLCRALEAEPVTNASRQGKLANWAHQLRCARSKEAEKHGAVLGVPSCYADIQRVCHVYGRDVSYLEVQRLMWKQHPGPAIQSIETALPPRSRGSAVHTAALHFHMVTPPWMLGERHGRTPVSISGPGCSGSLIALADQRVFPTVAAAQLGSEALHIPPFAVSSEEELKATPYAERFVATPCPLCGAPEESVYHLVTECTHASMVALQGWLQPRVVAQVLTIATGAVGALRRAHEWASPQSVLEQAALDFLRAAPQSLDPSSASSRFLTYWLLMGIPWPRWVGLPLGDAEGQPQSYPLVSGLGSMFDALNVQPSHLREWANQWLGWSEESLKELARVRREAVRGQATG